MNFLSNLLSMNFVELSSLMNLMWMAMLNWMSAMLLKTALPDELIDDSFDLFVENRSC